MRRDQAVVREVLEDLEKADDPLGISWYWIHDSIGAYHAYLLITAKLASGTVSETGVSSCRLTWAGHDFLDRLRNG